LREVIPVFRRCFCFIRQTISGYGWGVLEIDSHPPVVIDHGIPAGNVVGKAVFCTTLPSHEELLHFFTESIDLLCVADFEGRFQRLNPAWQHVLGWTLEELTACQFLEFVHRDDLGATLAVMTQLNAGDKAISFENRYRCKDGSWKWLQWTAAPIPGRQEIYAIARDVSRRVQLEQEILETLDRERERMGRELHDGLCQNLAGIAALSASVARRLHPTDALESAVATEIGELLAQSIQQIRDLARGLEPIHLKAIGLETALADFCLNTEARFRIACKSDCGTCPSQPDVERDIHLYRIVQEAVANAITHGRAERVDISLVFKNNRGRLTILDDGDGICDADNRKHGIGLHTMAYRARQVGALLTVERHSPRGTIVSCEFAAPVPPTIS
jgi:PAS domain S-box-containing protein